MYVVYNDILTLLRDMDAENVMNLGHFYAFILTMLYLLWYEMVVH